MQLVRRFACKLCDTVASSWKQINEHHKASHNKCYCKICGKACNTPSTLEQHSYMPFPCANCDARFAFASQLKQHRFKHCKVAAFMCSKCTKCYMHEGELVKHIKTQENITYKCDKCNYTMQGPKNLRQHQRLHSDELPYMCPQCYKQFHFWMQKKRHKCEPPVNTSETDSDWKIEIALHFWWQQRLRTFMYCPSYWL